MELDAEVELSGAVSLLGPLARHAIKSGVNENLATLKAILEAQVPVGPGATDSRPQRAPDRTR